MPKLTKEQIIEELESLEIEIPEGATKPQLEKILAEAEGKRPDEDPEEDSENEEFEEDEEDSKDEDEEEESEKIESEAKKEEPKKLKSETDKKEKKGEVYDYLRQYQYKKDMKFGSVQSDPSPGGKSATMKIHLLKQPKTSIFIPRAETEDPKVKLSVNLNGYRLDFPKQTYLELPEQIAEVIMESQKQQAAALQAFRTDRNKATEEALE